MFTPSLESFPPPVYFASPFFDRYRTMVVQELERMPRPEDKIMSVINALQALLSNERPTNDLSSDTCQRISCLNLMLQDPLLLKRNHYSDEENMTVYGTAHIPPITEFRRIADTKIRAKIADLSARVNVAQEQILQGQQRQLQALEGHLAQLKSLSVDLGIQIETDTQRILAGMAARNTHSRAPTMPSRGKKQ